jgi:hypothetical protein
MWANQISADGGLPADGDLGKRSAGTKLTMRTKANLSLRISTPPLHKTPRSHPWWRPHPLRTPQVDETPVTFPSSDIGEAPTIETVPPQKDNPVTSTTDPALVAFPGRSSDDAPSQNAPSAQGITFAPEVGTPERRGSPDPDAEPKRKRISSQNFQRLARRISVRAGSVSNIPILGSLRRDSSSASASAQAQPSTDTDAAPTVTSESPAASIQSEPDKDKGKKKEKEKKRRFL